MSSSKPQDDRLRTLLDEAESELSRRLHEACEVESRGVSSESATEIRHLEDTLLAAAMAAERTIAARRHLRDSADEEKSAPAASRKDAPPAERETVPAPDGTGVREFEDESGRSWRAWPVTPGLSHSHHVSRRSLGEFQEGWICFEALDNSGRRRLPRPGRRWSDLPPEELRRLLDEAIAVPPRKVRRIDLPGTPGSGDVH